MRTLNSSLFLLVVACGGPSAPEPGPAEVQQGGSDPAASGAVKAPTPDVPDAPKVEAAFEAEGVGPLPTGRSVDGFPRVAVQGFGLRLEVNPPFQATRMKGLYGEDDADILVVSWWDVTHPEAGQHGRVGLYNVGLVPGEAQPDAGDFLPVASVERDRVIRTLRLGTSGSYLRLPDGHNALGGFGTLSKGPAEQKWTVQVGDDPPVDFADPGVMLHSWDPSDGGPIHFDTQISKPFGAWPAPPVAPAPGAPEPE